MEQRLAGLAARQHGLLTRAQLTRSGLKPGAIRTLLRTRRLEPVHRRVYRVVGSPESWEQTLLAILLVMDDAVASHSSAARILGVEGRVARGDRHEVTTDRTKRPRLDGVRPHQSVLWLPEDTRFVRGFRTSSPARLAVDLSGRLDVSMLGKVVDGLLRRRVLRLPDLARTAGRLRSARGRRPRIVDAVLQARGAGYEVGDSDLEARIIRLLIGAGLPAPTAQHRVAVGTRRYRVDLAYPDRRLAIEIDSWAYHRWRSSFDGDRARRNDLTRAGYTVLQITDGMRDKDVVEIVAHTWAVLRPEVAPGRPELSQRVGVGEKGAGRDRTPVRRSDGRAGAPPTRRGG